MEGVPTKNTGSSHLNSPRFLFLSRGLGGLLRENRRTVNRLGISRTGLWSRGSLGFLQNDFLCLFGLKTYLSFDHKKDMICRSDLNYHHGL